MTHPFILFRYIKHLVERCWIILKA